MDSQLERYVLKLLQGGHALDEKGRQAEIDKLGPPGREVLRQIARREIEVEFPKLRTNAISALSFDQHESAETLQLFRELLNDDEPVIQLRTVRALARFNAKELVDPLRDLVRGKTKRPDVALAAARRLADLGGDEISEDLRALRERRLSLAPDRRSPSITNLDRLIAGSDGREPQGASEEEPRLEV